MIKYLPIVLTFLAFALTFNPTIAIIVLFLSALAYGFTPQLFVLVNGILIAAFIYEFFDNLIIALAVLLLTILGLFEFRRRRDLLNSSEAYENYLSKLKLFVVTPIFLAYFVIIILSPSLLKVRDIVNGAIKEQRHNGAISSEAEEDEFEFSSMKALEMWLFIKGLKYDEVKGGYAEDICTQSQKRTGEYINPYNLNTYATSEKCKINVYLSFITESMK